MKRLPVAHEDDLACAGDLRATTRPRSSPPMAYGRWRVGNRPKWTVAPRVTFCATHGSRTPHELDGVGGGPLDTPHSTVDGGRAPLQCRTWFTRRYCPRGTWSLMSSYPTLAGASVGE